VPVVLDVDAAVTVITWRASPLEYRNGSALGWDFAGV
jgi:hypothetical protein